MKSIIVALSTALLLAGAAMAQTQQDIETEIRKTVDVAKKIQDSEFRSDVIELTKNNYTRFFEGKVSRREIFQSQQRYTQLAIEWVKHEASLQKIPEETASVPASVMAGIRRRAKERWPNDYAMQEFEIDRQRKAYLAVEGKSARLSRAQATRWAESMRQVSERQQALSRSRAAALAAARTQMGDKPDETGLIYILTNSATPGRIRIGRTSGDVNDEVAVLNKDVQFTYELHSITKVYQSRLIELALRQLLAGVEDGLFYRVDPATAQQQLIKMARDNNAHLTINASSQGKSEIHKSGPAP